MVLCLEGCIGNGADVGEDAAEERPPLPRLQALQELQHSRALQEIRLMLFRPLPPASGTALEITSEGSVECRVADPQQFYADLDPDPDQGF